MNPNQVLTRAAWRLTLTGAAALAFSGCVNIPPEVKQSVVRSREAVAQLHTTHARDARGFSKVVNDHEVYVRETSDVVRRALRAQWEAEITASKIRTMAEYDRRASQELGIEFQAILKREVYSKFDRLERANLKALLDAMTAQSLRTKDPLLPGKIEAARRNIFDARAERENLVGGFYLTIEAALRNARFKFETEVEQKYADKLQPLLNDVMANPDSGKNLAEFNDRIEQKLVELDESYNSLDQALSDLSTYLDGEAMSRRFAGHFLKGVASALVSDLKEGKLGGVPLGELLDKKGPGFSQKLREVEGTMQTRAEAAVKESAEAAVKEAADKVIVPEAADKVTVPTPE